MESVLGSVCACALCVCVTICVGYVCTCHDVRA